MPYLRYSRNKKGYENTYVLHGSRTGGRPEVLYLFRTPPNIKVGRGALDPEVLSAIESANPELNFDWGKMRRDRPKPAVPSVRKVQRDKKPKPIARQRKSQVRADRSVDSKTDVSDILSKQSSLVEETTRETETSAGDALTHKTGQYEPTLKETAPVLGATDGSVDPADVESPNQKAQQEHPVSALLGVATLDDLRARYMELLVRFDNADLDNRARSALSERVNALDPDGWGAGEEVVHAIESFDREWQQISESIDV
jgi:hypothetical protein